jgi:hypothetical protein
VTHFFQSGEGCDAERTNLVSGMKWKKTEQGTRNNGRELENATATFGGLQHAGRFIWVSTITLHPVAKHY